MDQSKCSQVYSPMCALGIRHKVMVFRHACFKGEVKKGKVRERWRKRGRWIKTKGGMERW